MEYGKWVGGSISVPNVRSDTKGNNPFSGNHLSEFQISGMCGWGVEFGIKSIYFAGQADLLPG